MRGIFIIAVILIFCGWHLKAQNQWLKGHVKDAYSNQSLPFVNIIVYNTTVGTSTDTLGNFEINTGDQEFVQLKLSYLGYKPLITEEIYISRVGSNFIEIALEPTSQSITEVVVKSSPFIEKKESPNSLKRIGVDQIEKSAGANRDISKVIQSFPGVASTVSFRNDIIVRGGGPSENRFYVDGIEIPTINHFSTQGASGGPVGILNVDFIREVDFYSGAFPSSRGNALSSILEIKQKEGNKDKTDFKGTLGASEMGLSVSSPISEKTSMLASVRQSYLQFLFSALDLPFLPTFTDFQFKTKTKINTQNEITFLGFTAIDKFDLNDKASETPENQYILSYIPVNEQWSYTIGANYKHYFTKSYLSVVASRSHLDNSAFKYLNNIELPDNLTTKYSSTETDNKFRVELYSIGNQFTYNGGVSFESSSYTNATYRKELSGDNVIEVDYNTTLDFVKYGVFGTINKSVVNKRIDFSLGFRMDGNSYSESMSNLFNQFSPRLSVSVILLSPLSYNFSLGRYYQLPAYTTMGYKDSNNVLINKSNDLKYIYSDQFIMGLKYQPNNSSKYTFEGFYKKYGNYPFSIRDSISLANKGGDFGVVGDEEVKSIGNGRAYGFEIMARQKTSNGFSFVSSYTFVRSEFEDLSGAYIPSAWDNRHLLTLTINKELKRNWDIGIKWRYIGGAPYTPVDEDKTTLKEVWDSEGREKLDYNRFNEERLNAFHQLDIRLDKLYVFKKWALGFYLDIQNLYNFKIKDPVKYVKKLDSSGNAIIENPSVPESEQRYVFSKIITENGTVLPTIGIKVEF